MQGEEPSASLVHALGDEVGRIEFALVNEFFVLKRVVQLSIGHCSTVKPHVDQVKLALHGFACVAHQCDVVNIRAMNVYLVVVFLAVVTRNEAFLLEWITSHHACCDSFFNLVVKFLNTTYALLLSIVISPDGQWSAPVAAAAQVPVIEVLKPLPKATCAGVLGFPLDGLVKFHHAVFASGGANEPAIKGIVEHRFVGAPAVGIVVHVFLNLESGAHLLHADAHVDVQILGLAGCHLVILAVNSELGIVGVLYPGSGIFLIEFNINEVLNEVLV